MIVVYVVVAMQTKMNVVNVLVLVQMKDSTVPATVQMQQYAVVLLLVLAVQQINL